MRREARHAAVGVALELRSPSRPPLGGVLLRVRVRVRARVRVKVRARVRFRVPVSSTRSSAAMARSALLARPG